MSGDLPKRQAASAYAGWQIESAQMLLNYTFRPAICHLPDVRRSTLSAKLFAHQMLHKLFVWVPVTRLLAFAFLRVVPSQLWLVSTVAASSSLLLPLLSATRSAAFHKPPHNPTHLRCIQSNPARPCLATSLVLATRSNSYPIPRFSLQRTQASSRSSATLPHTVCCASAATRPT